MRQWNAALFDLDGTIIDSAPGIAATFSYTLEKYGIHCTDDQLREFMGPPLSESFAKMVSPEEVETCVQIYRQRYEEDGIFRCSVYEGIPELLQSLKENGWTVCLATSKLRKAAVEILERFGLAPFFDDIGGASADGRIERKEEVLHCVLSSSAMHEKNGIMIGDRFSDMEGARLCGLPAVGVLYGYGSERELSAYSPVALCKTPKELEDFLSLHFKR